MAIPEGTLAAHCVGLEPRAPLPSPPARVRATVCPYTGDKEQPQKADGEAEVNARLAASTPRCGIRGDPASILGVMEGSGAAGAPPLVNRKTLGLEGAPPSRLSTWDRKQAQTGEGQVDSPPACGCREKAHFPDEPIKEAGGNFRNRVPCAWMEHAGKCPFLEAGQKGAGWAGGGVEQGTRAGSCAR